MSKSSVTILASVVLAVAACSSAPAGASPAASAQAPTEAPATASAAASAAAGPVEVNVGSSTIKVDGTPKKLAMFIAGSAAAYTWSAALEEGAKDAAAKNGVELVIYEANFDATTQFSQLQNAITAGEYQGLIIQPITSQTCQIVQEDAVKAQLLVVAASSTLCGTDDKDGDALAADGTVAFVGGMYGVPGFTDFTKSIVDANPGAHKVIQVLGPEANGETLAWKAATAQTYPTNPDFQIVGTVFTDYSTPDAYKRTQDVLQANPDVDVVISNYIDMTKGVINAIEALDRKGIKVYDFAGSKESVDLLASDKALATFPSYPRSMGSASVQAIMDAAAGLEVPRAIVNDGNPDAITEVITKDMLSTYTPEY